MPRRRGRGPNGLGPPGQLRKRRQALMKGDVLKQQAVRMYLQKRGIDVTQKRGIDLTRRDVQAKRRRGRKFQGLPGTNVTGGTRYTA